MKKITALMLSLVMLFAFVGCNKEEEKTTDTNQSTITQDGSGQVTPEGEITNPFTYMEDIKLSDSLNTGEFILGAIKQNLKTEFKVYQEDGWEIASASVKNKLAAGEEISVVVKNDKYFIFTPEYFEVTFTLKNNTDKEKSIEDCLVLGVSVNAKIENGGPSNLCYFELSKHTTIYVDYDKLVETFGEPTKVEEFSEFNTNIKNTVYESDFTVTEFYVTENWGTTKITYKAK